MAYKPVGADDNGKFPPRVQAALAATYVRFEDENGNPLEARNVVIKVDSTSGEIIDIVSEA
jgi:hypothetical protein